MPPHQVPTLSERAARFAREALDPPPVPEKRVAWAGGPIVTSDRREALLKLLVRKAAQGVALTADQQRALDNLSREGLTDDQQRALDAMGKENSAQPPRGEGPKRGEGKKKKKRGPPPRGCLITPSPPLADSRAANAVDASSCAADLDLASPCFHHLSSTMQQVLAKATTLYPTLTPAPLLPTSAPLLRPSPPPLS